MVRKEHAKLNKEKIRGFISPATPDDEDIAAARAGEKLNAYLTEEAKLNKKMALIDWWMLITGTGFGKVYYNQSITVPGPEQEVMDPTTGMPMAGPDGQPLKETTLLQGMPVVEVVTPLQLYVDNLDEPDLDNQAWVMHVTVKTAKEIEEQYQIPGLENSSNLAASSLDSKLASVQGYSSGSAKKGIEVKEVWVKPNVEFPDGMTLTWCDQAILNYSPAWEYKHREYPFFQRRHVESGRFYSESNVTDAIQLQTEYNRSRSQIVENKNRLARPMLLAERGSINVNAIQGKPGEIVEYNPGARPPSPLQLPDIPAYVIDNLNLIAAEIGENFSQEDLNQSIPQGVTAATAIAYVQENRDAVLLLTLQDKELCYQRVCRHLLSLVGQYWDAQRQIKVVGEGQNFEAFLLAASDMRGNTDWRVVVGSATPQSRSAQQALMMELMKMGAIPVAQALQFLELGDTTRLFEEMQIDVREAERQNLKMSKGVPAETKDWQDLAIHVMVHDNYRKREEFENLEDDVKALFRHHVFMDMFMYAQKNGFDPMTEMDPMMLGAMQQGMQMDPLFVDDNVERALRSFVTMAQQAGGANVPLGGSPQGGAPPTQ